jgi:hypothetical protein
MVVDVNGDRRGDIAGFGENGVYVSKGKGNGRFDEARLVCRNFGCEQGWEVGKHPRFMVDVTGDGCADIIGFKDGAAFVAFNDGEGNFGVAHKLTEKDPQTRSQKVADFRGDASTTVRYVRRMG